MGEQLVWVLMREVSMREDVEYGGEHVCHGVYASRDLAAVDGLRLMRSYEEDFNEFRQEARAKSSEILVDGQCVLEQGREKFWRCTFHYPDWYPRVESICCYARPYKLVVE